MSSEKQRSSRRMATIKAKMLRSGDWQDLTIANISETGLMGRAAEPPAQGEVLEIRHRGYAMTGDVVWAVGRRFGFRAAEPIDLTQLLSASEIAARRAEDLTPTARFWHWMKKR